MASPVFCKISHRIENKEDVRLLDCKGVGGTLWCIPGVNTQRARGGLISRDALRSGAREREGKVAKGGWGGWGDCKIGT
jgi:hypothetical protein